MLHFLTILFTILITISANAQQWYRGNLHTHSYWSDGDDFPEMIVDWYKTNGYDFIALSDHNVLAEGEFWKLLPNTEEARQRFEAYLDKFGKDWVVYQTNDKSRTEVKLKTLKEYRPKFEEAGKFLIIQSEEITDGFEGKPIHMNATNVQELIAPAGGSSVTEVMQNNINQVNKQREQTGKPMFPHINHPNFGWAISVDDILPLTGERFFEVYNGHPLVNNYGDDTRLGTEAIWDILITNYLKEGKPLIYGLAVDDAHNYHNYDGEHSNPGRGWVMVQANELTTETIIAAMEAGDFYSSTGVTLASVSFENQTLTLKVKPENNVNYLIQFWGTKEGANREEMGELLQEISGNEASYQLKNDDLYVRAKIISDKPQLNPFQEGDTEMAWTQPVMPEE
ncbi:MAG: histidinol-phosphatase [Bacteroidota bacterium]